MAAAEPQAGPILTNLVPISTKDNVGGQSNESLDGAVMRPPTIDMHPDFAVGKSVAADSQAMAAVEETSEGEVTALPGTGEGSIKSSGKGMAKEAGGVQAEGRTARDLADAGRTEELQETQRRVGNLSPRGGCHRNAVQGEASLLETLHIDPVVISGNHE